MQLAVLSNRSFRALSILRWEYRNQSYDSKLFLPTPQEKKGSGAYHPGDNQTDRRAPAYF